MMKHFVTGAMLVVALLTARPALADTEPFDIPPYTAGFALSDFFWTNGDNTTGVISIEDVGGAHGGVAKMVMDGPDPGSVFPLINGSSTGWGGPGRDNGQLWFAVDVEKGSSDGMTSLTDFIWSLSFFRSNGANILTLDGGLNTFRLKSTQNGYTSASFNLNDGWNQIAVLNDTSVNPDTTLFLDGVPVTSFDSTTGPLSSSTTTVARVDLARLSRGGTGDNFVGMMRFDNIVAENFNILVPEPATFVLLGLAVPALFLARRFRRA
jgi:hypothetical protein